MRYTEVKKQNLFSAGIEHLGIYYDNPKITFADQLSCDICLRVCKEPQPDNEIGVKKIASGKYAVFIHIGPYNEVGDTYDKIYGEWLPQSGYQTGNKPCYEKYISDPRRVIPEKLKTELYISIE